MQNRLPLLLLGLVVIGLIVYWATRPSERSADAEISELRTRTTQTNSSCGTPGIKREQNHREASWTCQINTGWGEYTQFLGAKLTPEYREKSRTEATILFVATTKTDQYSLLVERTSAKVPGEVRITQTASPY